MSDKWDELIDKIYQTWYASLSWKDEDVEKYQTARAALRSAIAEVENAKRDAEDYVQNIINVAQKYQPAGSPPPGDAQILVSWIMRSLADGVPPANRPSKLAELESALNTANEDANNLLTCLDILSDTPAAELDPDTLVLINTKIELHRSRVEGMR
jgi:hypothetical protein